MFADGMLDASDEEPDEYEGDPVVQMDAERAARIVEDEDEFIKRAWEDGEMM